MATVLILPTFINWNQYREEITSQVRNALGQELNIKGDIKLTILPSPALAINGIHLANMEGPSTPDIVTMKSHEENNALIPLLGQNIQITSVRLVEPVINIEILEDGTNNLAFGAVKGSSQGVSFLCPPLTHQRRARRRMSMAWHTLRRGLCRGIDSFVIENG